MLLMKRQENQGYKTKIITPVEHHTKVTDGKVNWNSVRTGTETYFITKLKK